jgi:GNAT superfamily N-acetyltransferase
MPLSIHHGYLPGAIGRIVELHASYYHRHIDFGLHCESKVARELSEFCGRLEAGRDRLWLAMNDGNIEGSIAIDGSRANEEGAHLRWFITSSSARGAGIGTALLESAMAFCRVHRYDRVYLWTFEGLDAARHLYEKVVFQLVHQCLGNQWGAEVIEQQFEWRS